jgi:hypothetical protein
MDCGGKAERDPAFQMQSAEYAGQQCSTLFGALQLLVFERCLIKERKRRRRSALPTHSIIVVCDLRFAER